MKSLIKNIVLFSVVLLSFSIIFLQEETYAAEKDLDVLYEKAKNGISDLSDDEMQKILENIDIQITNNESKIDFGINGLNNLSEPKVQTYVTAEILESDDDTQLIAVTTFSDINPWSGSTYDNSYSVRAYATLYVEAKKVIGTNTLQLKRVTGGWEILDSRVVKSITNREFGVNNFGLGIVPGVLVSEDWGPIFVQSNTFDKQLDATAINADTNPGIKITTKATISSSLVSWNLVMALAFGKPGERQD